MNKIMISLLAVVLLAGCKKESTPATALNEQVPLTAEAQKAGNFKNGAYGSVTGSGRIYKIDNGFQLALENFSSSNGPDLKVYLSKETEPVNFINLGSLKSVNGNQLYNIPSGINPNDYKYALIYCQQFKHLFGYAELAL